MNVFQDVSLWIAVVPAVLVFFGVVIKTRNDNFESREDVLERRLKSLDEKVDKLEKENADLRAALNEANHTIAVMQRLIATIGIDFDGK